jgi:cell division protein FtsZ
MTQFEAGFDGLKFVIEEDIPAGAKVKVIGVGGGGTNAVSRLIESGRNAVDCCVINTDAQALTRSAVVNKLLIGHKVTRGLGAGADPHLGRQAALEDTERIIEILEGADMVFVAAGLGGGTGTGAAPVVASLARELGALTVAVVTQPFEFEGPQRAAIAEKGIEDLAATVDAVLSIPNERLAAVIPPGTPLTDAFRAADDVLRQAVEGIADIMTTPGLINRDFSDVRNILQNAGRAVMGTAVASGHKAACDAARQAIQCPMAAEDGIKGAGHILIHIIASGRVSLHEMHDACNLIREAAENEEAQISFGLAMDEKMDGEVKVTVIASGFRNAPAKPEPIALQIAELESRVGFFSPRPVLEPLPPRMEFPVEPEYMPEPEPAPMMQQTEPESAPLANRPSLDEETVEMEDLDVPAFLRRGRRFLS